MATKQELTQDDKDLISRALDTYEAGQKLRDNNRQIPAIRDIIRKEIEKTQSVKAKL